MDRQTLRQANRWIGRHSDKQMDRQTLRQTNR